MHARTHALAVLTNAHSVSEILGNITLPTDAFKVSIIFFTSCGELITGIWTAQNRIFKGEQKQLAFQV